MQDSPATRRVRRTRRSAGGGGSLSSSTSIQGDADLHEQVSSMASPVSLTEGEHTHDTPVDPGAEFTPSGRMSDVEAVGGKYAKEYRLKLLHRMLMRNLPLDAIADSLKVSVATVVRDRRELNRLLSNQAQQLDINHLIGDTMGFYREIQGMSMKAASSSKLPMNMRLAAMRTGLSAKNDMHKFLNTSGVYDVLRYRVAEDSSGSDIDKLMHMTEQLIGSDDIDLNNLDSMGGFEDTDEDEHIQLI